MGKISTYDDLRILFAKAHTEPTTCIIDGKWATGEMCGLRPGIVHTGTEQIGKHVYFNFPVIKVEEGMKSMGMFPINDDKRGEDIFCEYEAEDLIRKIHVMLNSYMASADAKYIHITSDFEIKTRLDSKYPMYVLVGCGCYILRDGLTVKEIQEKQNK